MVGPVPQQVRSKAVVAQDQLALGVRGELRGAVLAEDEDAAERSKEGGGEVVLVGRQRQRVVDPEEARASARSEPDGVEVPPHHEDARLLQHVQSVEGQPRHSILVPSPLLHLRVPVHPHAPSLPCQLPHQVDRCLLRPSDSALGRRGAPPLIRRPWRLPTDPAEEMDAPAAVAAACWERTLLPPDVLVKLLEAGAPRLLLAGEPLIPLVKRFLNDYACILGVSKCAHGP
mmetsp:Transcript_28264/g.91515  ORF Transcript_28264/g.91515 Transcript_28264/m.91515 type:complete len:230 (+) Transcript_28264:493-1182(+)